MAQSRSPHACNINEKIVFEKASKIIETCHFPKPLADISKKMIEKVIDKQYAGNRIIIEQLEEKQEQIIKRKDALLDLRLDGNIDQETFQLKNQFLVNELFDLQKQQEQFEAKPTQIKTKTKRMLELAESLSDAYRS